jgi:hypothetical protein
MIISADDWKLCKTFQLQNVTNDAVWPVITSKYSSEAPWCKLTSTNTNCRFVLFCFRSATRDRFRWHVLWYLTRNRWCPSLRCSVQSSVSYWVSAQVLSSKWQASLIEILRASASHNLPACTRRRINGLKYVVCLVPWSSGSRFSNANIQFSVRIIITSTRMLTRIRKGVVNLFVGRVTTSIDSLRAGRSGDRMPVGARFSVSVQARPGDHPASCTMDTDSLSLE